MPEVPATQPRENEPHRVLAPGLALAWDKERPQPIDIVAPDEHCSALLLKEAGQLFPAVVVYGSAWVVRLEPPTGREWAFELLSVVERWLESCRLPCAKVLYDGRAYLIRASTDGAWFRGAAESAHESSEFSVPGIGMAEPTAHMALLALITTGAGAGMIWLGLDRGMLRFRRAERRCPSCGRLTRSRVCPTCGRS